MKTNLLSLLFLLLTFSASTQPVINGFTPGLGDQFVLSVVEQQLDEGDAGANVVWDFSDIPQSSLFNYMILTPQNTPGSVHFPSANLATSVIPEDFPETLYFYYNIDESAWVEMGSYFVLQQFENIISYTDPRTLYTYPLSFGGSGQDVFTGMYGGIIETPIAGTVNYTVDAYGQLILPSGTYDDVLRLSMQETESQELAPGIIAQTESQSYIWVSQDYAFPILVSERFDESFPGEPTETTYSTTSLVSYSPGPVSTSNIYHDRKVLAYPNPSTGILHFSNLEKGELKNIRILDITGSVVEASQFKLDENTLYLESLTNGIYIAELELTDGFTQPLRIQLIR
jgi:hypothetical protein